jgi:hypothetical protein
MHWQRTITQSRIAISSTPARGAAGTMIPTAWSSTEGNTIFPSKETKLIASDGTVVSSLKIFRLKSIWNQKQHLRGR